MISEFPLFLYTTLAGIAIGACVAKAIVPMGEDRKNPWVFSLVCLVLLAIGGVALLFHLGHPERIFNAFANPQAGITQEGIVTCLFGIALLVEFIMALVKKAVPRWLSAVEAVLGVILAFVMGMAYFGIYGTQGWSDASAVPFFVIGDLAMGAAAYLLCCPRAMERKGYGVYLIAIEVLAGISIAWVCGHFASLGLDGALLIAGLVIGPVLSTVMAAFARGGKAKALPYLICASSVIGIAMARYAFYMASVI